MITKEQADEKVSMESEHFFRYNNFYHTFLKMADNVTPIKARRNGKTKTYKSKKFEGVFEIPIKIGWKDYGKITQENAHEWSVTLN